MEQYRKVKSKSDGLEIDVVEVLPEGEPRAIIQIVHGMQEHKERYLDFMKFMARHGFACVAHDHRGHGKSIKCEDDLGYFYEQKAEYIVEDINDVIADLLVRYPHAPVIIFGHSMGSLISRKYLKKYDDRLKGMILCGVVCENSAAKPGLMLVKTMSKAKGDHYISKMVSGMAEGAYDKQVDSGSWLSYNEDNVKAFHEDELCGKPFTLNGYQNLMQLCVDVFDDKGWQMKNPDLPIHLIAGEDDPVIGGKKGFEGSVKFLKDRGYKNVTEKLYPHMRHEILNELNHQVVYDDILKFVEGLLK